jgi:hypothetical protein
MKISISYLLLSLSNEKYPYKHAVVMRYDSEQHGAYRCTDNEYYKYLSGHQSHDSHPPATGEANEARARRAAHDERNIRDL